MTSWASWTTSGVFTGAGGVRTVEVGPISGDLTVHTTWIDGQAEVAVQFTGALDWFTLPGSPVPCPSQEESRSLHQAVIEAIRLGATETALSTTGRRGSASA
ncbi:hypothetical protein AB0436_11595 [Streptomyces sp. NPDC051322]|uniref:hypothetical protein n=1 Tax=Streptomyces sp. NPDC051322 TaxID=3154645 RepID=UPI00344DA30E